MHISLVLTLLTHWFLCFFSSPHLEEIHTFTHTHTHSLSDLFSIPNSSPQRERLSQEQCKLGKMFRKVAFPTGTSQLQLWVSTLCVCMCSLVRVCVSQFLHLHLWVWKCKLLHMCLRAWKCERLDECVCSSLFLPGRSGLQTGLRF